MYTVTLPYSKSIAARLLAVRLMSGTAASTELDKALARPQCVDIEVMKAAVSKLYSSDGEVVIDLKDSGTAKHLLTALCACRPGLTSTLTMSERLGERPFGALPQMLNILTDAKIDVRPREIRIVGGRFIGTDMQLQAEDTISSQYITALMLIAPSGKTPLRMSVNAQQSSLPYIKMTAALMRKCGVNVTFNQPYSKIEVSPGKYHIPTPDMLERDWSAAAFFYEYAFVTGKQIDIEGLTPPDKSVQGDAVIAEIFGAADTRVELNMRNTPDLVPPVAVGCALKGVPFRLSGISHLRYKESDRREALRTIIECFGIQVHVGSDYIEMSRKQTPKRPSGVVPCFNDHRIAMSLVPAMALFPDIKLDNPGCVDKSFPDFWNQIKYLKVGSIN